tara:strand:- start:1365 stop:2387 length:1023 start_codon:yes stop_codon:yes gene_type:complete
MAIATSYNVLSTKGARENLENVMKTVSPRETPIYSTISQSAAPKATLNEWLVDTLADPVGSGGNIDGADLTISDAANLIDTRARLGNRVATLRDIFAVSRQAEMVDVAPGGSLFASSKAKSLIQLKNSLEVAIASGNDQSAGSGSAGSKMAGLGVFSNPTATGNTFDTSLKQGFRAVSGSRVSLASLTESAFRGLLQAVYTASGSKGTYRLFAGPALVNKITDYTRSTVTNGNFNFDQDVKDGVLKLSVIQYISDWGTVDIVPDIWLGRNDGGASGTDTALGTVNTDRGYLIPSDDTVSLKFLEGMTIQDLPDNGAGKRAFSECMATIRVANPRALGSIV